MRLHLPYAIVVKLHAHEDNVAILKPEDENSGVARLDHKRTDVIYLLYEEGSLEFSHLELNLHKLGS